MNIATRQLDEPMAAFRREIPADLKDIYHGELGQNGHWLVANISTASFWPINPQKVRWRGVDIWIMPVTKSTFPALAMMVPPGKGRSECEELMMRFLSMLSWVEERGFMVDGIGGGNLPRPMGRLKEHGLSVCDEFDLSYFPEVTDNDAMLALALMREGRGLNHAGYAFLSLYRVLEVKFPTKRQCVAWISASLPGLAGHGVQEALAGISAQGVIDVARHLYESGRCAMAHANRHPIVDPDKPADVRRLNSELPIMRALAKKAIEELFGVETSATNFRKHLYELDGFKRILGPEIVRPMQDGALPSETTVDIPLVNIRLRRHDPYAPLEGMRCTLASPCGKLLRMRFESSHHDVAIDLALDFEAERIQFDLFRDVRAIDAGSAESAERVHEVTRFWHNYFGNGQLQIFNAETGELIGRKDAYLPVNMYQDGDGVAADLAGLKMEAERRRERDRRYGEALQQNGLGYAVTAVRPETA
jgi:hypothetical protein